MSGEKPKEWQEQKCMRQDCWGHWLCHNIELKCLFSMLCPWIKFYLHHSYFFWSCHAACGIILAKIVETLFSTTHCSKCYMWIFFFGCTAWHVESEFPWSGMEPVSPVVEVWSLNHWTTREIPLFFFFPQADEWLFFFFFIFKSVWIFMKFYFQWALEPFLSAKWITPLLARAFDTSINKGVSRALLVWIWG